MILLGAAMAEDGSRNLAGVLPLDDVGSTQIDLAGRLAELVTRRPSPSDGRVVVVSITDEGRRVAAKATDSLNSEVFTRPGLPPDRVRDLVDVLRELRADAGDLG